ncbi:MAG: inositol-3-phosphate synthase, partial [Actinomycetota bacterium]
MNSRKLGIAIIGLGGAVGTTVVAGIELLKKGKIGTEGLPLANLNAELIKDLANYENIVFGGWDLFGEHLAKAAEEHDVLTHQQFVAVETELRRIKPWRAVGNLEFLANIDGENQFSPESSLRASIEKIQADLQAFKKTCDAVVVINLGSTEKLAETGNEIFNSLADFEKALDNNAKEISPAMLYAYAAIAEQVPYGNFTPSVSADIPALVEFADKQGVPIAGKDGKTGQTMIKSVLAPAFKTRALKVEGWFSTNILGNRDGLAL